MRRVAAGLIVLAMMAVLVLATAGVIDWSGAISLVGLMVGGYELALYCTARRQDG
jgi:hypothetical protein